MNSSARTIWTGISRRELFVCLLCTAASAIFLSAFASSLILAITPRQISRSRVVRGDGWFFGSVNGECHVLHLCSSGPLSADSVRTAPGGWAVSLFAQQSPNGSAGPANDGWGSIAPAEVTSFMVPCVDRHGFGYLSGSIDPNFAGIFPTPSGRVIKFLTISLPDWSLILVFAIGAAISSRITWLKCRTVRRMQTGKCVRCGYDLRGTLERCPECGRHLGGSLSPRMTTFK